MREEHEERSKDPHKWADKVEAHALLALTFSMFSLLLIALMWLRQDKKFDEIDNKMMSVVECSNLTLEECLELKQLERQYPDY